jgi:serine protease Do
MKVRDIVFLIVGVIIVLAALFMYDLLRSSSRHYTDRMEMTALNAQVSRERANAIVVAANRAAPAVVSITVIQTRIVSTSPYFSPFADDRFNQFFRDFFPERYYREQVKSLGTGVIISSEGYILTNEHLVENATDIHIVLPDGRQYRGEILVQDKTIDLALIKIDASRLPYVDLGNSDDLMIGEWVIALGNPFAFLLEDTRPTVTVGVVSALNRSIKSTRDDRFYKNMIQTDAAINPGNSGGPLVNILGQVIGINTFIFTSSGGSEGIGFARPINMARKFIDEALAYGKVRKPWIGLWLQNVAAEHAGESSSRPSGVFVNGVDTGSAAAQADIREGDRIVTANGQQIIRLSDWDRIIANVFVSDTLSLNILRNGDSLDVRFVVEEYVPREGTKTRLGIYVDDIDAQIARKFDLTMVEGIVVTGVDKNSVGARLGLRPGDVILQVGNNRIKNRNDFLEAMKNIRESYFIIGRAGLIIQLYFGL